MMRALFFDLDNTLIDRDGAYRQYANELLVRVGCDADSVREALLAEIVQHDRHGRANRAQHCEWLVEQLNSYVRWTAGDFWKDQYARLANFVAPIDELNQFLKALKTDYRLILITNGSTENQRRKLTNAGLFSFFDTVLISGECGFEKPHPAMFKMALERVECQPTEVLMIGDDDESDIAGAANVGIAGLKMCYSQMNRASVTEKGNVRESLDLIYGYPL